MLKKNGSQKQEKQKSMKWIKDFDIIYSLFHFALSLMFKIFSLLVSFIKVSEVLETAF